jgi:hypothetical protein
MNVDAGRVDSVLDAKRLPGLEAALELLLEFSFGDDLLDPAANQRKLLLH